MLPHNSLRSRKAFTLIELLVVIAIIAILAIVVVLTLNPAQLLAQSRDANRVSDMATLNTAIGLYQTDIGGVGGMGTSSVIYTSFPDSSSTCGTIGLSLLPPSYAYNCAASTSSRNVNGLGWIPLNFSIISAGSPFGSLPVDPTNQSSSRLFYTYNTSGGQYEVTASMESQKYRPGGTNDAVAGDGGTLPSVYEKGTAIGLEPLDYGDPSLLGYWAFDEGTGTVAYDYSGNNATGSLGGPAVGTSGYYSPGRVGAWAATFDGTATGTQFFAGTHGTVSQYTLAFWMKGTTASGNVLIAMNFGATSFYPFNAPSQYRVVNGNFAANPNAFGVAPSFASYGSAWHHLAFTADDSNMYVYIDGVYQTSIPRAVVNGSYVNPGVQVGRIFAARDLIGTLDDLRVYNRALSAAEIRQLYSMGK